ncbi:MAG: hypothetical protein NTX64_03545 [Elusimicrobia bacterium]|nr:hypothetical protein [Elusimicrobiota bacterium]
MVTHEIELRLSITPAGVRFALVLALCVLFPRLSSPAADVSTVDVYYPIPSGYHDAVDVLGQLPVGAPSWAAILAQNSGRVIIGSDFQSGAAVDIGYDWGAVFGSAANGTVAQRLRLQVGNQAHTAKMNIDGCLWLPYSIMNPGKNWRCKWQ